jgi:hypothetical protein
MVLDALFTAGVVDPIALAKWMAEGSEEDASLRSLQEGALLRPLQALIMCAPCASTPPATTSRMHRAHVVLTFTAAMCRWLAIVWPGLPCFALICWEGPADSITATINVCMAVLPLAAPHC